MLALNTGFGGDQVHMLRTAVSLINGHFEPFLKLLKGPGTNPGSLIAVLTAGPIAITHDYRSAMIVVLIEHILSLIILLKVAKAVFGPQSAVYVMILFWMNPFRMYNGSILWEPAFLTIAAVVQLYALYQQREEAKFWPSFLIGLSFLCTIQMHNSWLLLFFSTLMLVWRKLVRLDYRGVVAGMALASLTLIPTALFLIRREPLVFDEQQTVGYFGKGLVTVVPTLKSFVYCVGLGGFDVVRELKESTIGPAAYRPWIIFLQLLCVVSVLISVVANFWYYRPLFTIGILKRFRAQEDHATTPEERWIRDYVLSFVVALLMCAALAPSYLQGWQVVLAAPAMLFPVLAWATKRWERTTKEPRATVSAFSYVAAQCCVIVSIFLAHSAFNRSPGIPSVIDPQKHAALMPYIPLKP